MKLSDKAVQEFKAIFHREFKRELSDDEARGRAESFMRLILLLLRPSPPNDNNATGRSAVFSPPVDEPDRSGKV